MGASCDPRMVIAISGPVRAGKSELAHLLRARLSADAVSTKQILLDEYAAVRDVLQREPRGELQTFGEKLDRETTGRWVQAAVRRRAARLPAAQTIIVDAVRIPDQVHHLRADGRFRVLYIHLSASLETLRKNTTMPPTGRRNALRMTRFGQT